MNEFPVDPFQTFVVNSTDPCVQATVSIPEVIPRPTFQPLVDPQLLDTYSHEFYKRLQQRHPEWRAAFQIGTTGEERFLYLEVPCPSAWLSPMWISAEGGRITVGFGEIYHAHFATYPPNNDDEMFEEAMSFIGDVMADKRVIVCLISGSRTGTSWNQDATEQISLPKGYSTITDQHIRVCSWSRKVDRELDVKESA